MESVGVCLVWKGFVVRGVCGVWVCVVCVWCEWCVECGVWSVC